MTKKREAKLILSSIGDNDWVIRLWIPFHGMWNLVESNNLPKLRRKLMSMAEAADMVIEEIL